MYLKRLEVFGFKTFAERVEVEFSPGITAVVGPNGAGKSNLADAILWVLGEQSLKSLRSSRSQDVIFSGSQQKKPVGLAEVSLTLDNGDGRLGLDFPEVTVTRRVYRSGEGEYLLNRIPCRLRDIHNLFLDTGIGRQAYSIINQSQIDAVLSVRPEDRRELIEEVAGVGKYRQRKKETMRKLEAASLNLLRVNDILAELEGQLEPLSRQSEKAREYTAASKELSALRLSLLVSDHDSFSTSLARAKEKEAELEAAVEASRTQEMKLSSDEIGLRAELDRVEKEQEELRMLAARLAQEAERQQGEQALAREKMRAAEARRQSLEEDCRQLEESLRHSLAQQQQTEAAQEEIAARETQGRAALQEKEAALGQAGEGIAARQEDLAAQRAQQLESLGKIAERRNSHAQGTSLLKAAEARLTRLAEENAAARLDLDTRAQEADKKDQERQELQSSLPELQQQLEGLLSESRQAGETLQNCETAQAALEKETLEARARLQALEQLAASREGLSPAVRSLLGEGFLLVSDLLRVSSKCAAAVEAALGPWLEALVCQNEQEALRARELLRQNGGQARFLLKDEGGRRKDKEQPQAFAGQGGFLGRVVDQAQFAEEYRPLFERLLGQVLTAEDLQAALRIRSTSFTIVTLDGEVVSAAGLCLGEKQAAGPLSRNAEMEDIKERLAALEAETARAAEATQQAKTVLETLTQQADETREQIRGAESRKAALEENLALLRAEMERGRQRLAGLEAEDKGLREEMEESRKEQAVVEQEIQALEAGHQEVEDGLAAAENALSSLQGQKEGFAREIEEAKIALASLAGERQAQQAEIQTQEKARQTFAAQIESRRENLRLLEAERQSLEASLSGVSQRQEELQAACQRARADLDQVGLRRQGFLESIAAKLEETKTGREQREASQASLHRLQLRITQLEGELAFLLRNLEEDHRISLEKAREIAPLVESRKEAQEKAASLQASLEGLGTVNLGAMEEYERVKTRLDFLSGQRQDLEKAREDLEKVISEIDAAAREKFLECFQAVQKEFDDIFKRLFEGGETELRLTGETEILEAGIDVEVTVPGKRRQNLLLLSGGERALTAMALVFALLRVKPTPFVVLDEIDAPLDDSNVGRYTGVLRDFARASQFIVITHNKSTMESADTLYGVTMEKPGVSTLLGMKLSELPAA